MRITIQNFGAIKHFEFDTEKDMYLIFGKNSVGKSYGISLVYLILKLFANRGRDAFDPEVFFFLTNDPDVEDVIHKMPLRKGKRIDLANDINRHLVSYLKTYLIVNLNHSLINSFNNIEYLKNQLTSDALKLTIESPFFQSTLTLGIRENITPIAIEIIDFQCKQKYPFEIRNEENKNNRMIYHLLFMRVVSFFFKEFEAVSEVYFLPASRSGLYQGLGSFAQIAAEFSKSRSLISKPIHLPAISEPLADYFLRLSETNSKNQSGLLSYTDAIEHDIMSGNVEFDDDTKRLIFKPKDTQLKLDLSSTSSMVSELAPIVAYLKHILPNADTAKPAQKPLIFIEEPEAHLHPETQVKLMDVLARLVKDNKIKLVMTSHSNYIFNKASNLVMDDKIDPDKFKAVLFRMTDTGSVAENMATDAYGIDDDNFIDTAESLYEEKLAIINKLNG